MNNNHLQQIFAHYIDRFEELNNEEHGEYYKWQIALYVTIVVSETQQFL